MAVESEKIAELADEFELIAETAAEAGAAPGALPRVRRSWVNVPAGGHVSGVFWGDGPPELVFLHDRGESARAWDAVALTVGLPSVAIDLPGHGRSDWRRDGRYEPAVLASSVAEAIRSFAPRARLIAGTGLGGLTAIALRRRHARLLSALALVGTLPGTGGGQAGQWSSPERFADRSAALAALTARRPEHGSRALRREVQYELLQEPDGLWAWRHHPGNLPAPTEIRPADSGAADGGGAGPRDAERLCSEFAALAVPVALISGDRPGAFTAADRAKARERVPGIRVITIPGAGRDIPGTQPAALADVLGQFLASARPDAASRGAAAG
jgi:pimeloyl-ACP methyl ester carboxylesterase